MSENTIKAMNQLLNVNDVAEILKISPDMVRKHIKNGNLRATKFNRTFVIDRSDLDEYMKQRARA